MLDNRSLEAGGAGSPPFENREEPALSEVEGVRQPDGWFLTTWASPPSPGKYIAD
jgi:hypothetical protein